LKTLKQVLKDEDDWSVNSPAMDFRQRSPLQGNKAIVEHIMRMFRFPVGFENFVYVSQILQALAIKTAVGLLFITIKLLLLHITQQSECW
jgi:beta-mannosidase